MDFYQFITESQQSHRYSVEVNYRTTMKEVEEGFAKLVLGYVSAALKNANYHVKMVFQEKPYRIIVSTNNWQEGEWVYVASYNDEKNCFIVSKGFFNKRIGTVTVQQSKSCEANSAAELYKDLMNHMAAIKDDKPHHMDLKGAKMQTGPKQGSMRPGQGLLNKGQLN